MANIREEITSKIRDELVAGNFEAGHPLRETALAKRFGVSRGPIRDAFLQLSQEGFLAYQANRGVTVRHPPAEEDRDFVASLRAQIEQYVVAKACQSLTPKQFLQIETVLLSLKKSCESKDVVEVAKADMAFHQVIILECGGEDHIQIWRPLCTKMLLTYSRLNSFDEVYREHAEIFEALQSRNQEKVMELIERNITSPMDATPSNSDNVAPNMDGDGSQTITTSTDPNIHHPPFPNS